MATDVLPWTPAGSRPALCAVWVMPAHLPLHMSGWELSLGLRLNRLVREALEQGADEAALRGLVQDCLGQTAAWDLDLAPIEGLGLAIVETEDVQAVIGMEAGEQEWPLKVLPRRPSPRVKAALEDDSLEAWLSLMSEALGG